MAVPNSLFLNIATWNATGIMSSASYLSELLDNNDIDVCGIAEHWLFNHDMHFLDCINNKFICHSIADPDLLLPSNRRVGKGGICILFNKRLKDIVSPIRIDSKYILGIQIMPAAGNSIFVFQVYFPCKNYSIATYKNCIDELETILCIYKSKGKLYLMGDYNTELASRNQPCFKLDSRGKMLVELMNNYNLLAVNSLELCSNIFAG